MTIIEDIVTSHKKLVSRPGTRSDTVISTGVRLARNVPSLPFPHMMKMDDWERLQSLIAGYLDMSRFSPGLRYLILSELSSQERRLLRESNLISSGMENSTQAGVVVDLANPSSILINDVDHFRIEVTLPGLQLRDALDLGNGVDNDLNNSITYLFSQEQGFLGATPAENGTGLQISVVLHLPVLNGLKVMSELTPSILKKGFEIAGAPGKGKMVAGGLFLLRSTGGFRDSELQLLKKGEDIILKLIELEDQARDSLFNDSHLDFEDRVMRSLGILKFAGKLNYGEAIDHLSEVRLGVVMSVIRDYSLKTIDELMVNVQWAHLQFHANRLFSSVLECDRFRADFVKKILKESEGKDV